MAILAYQQTQFLISASNLATCPADKGVEIAFAGRSNAGKSSAINRITQQKNLARISKTPGRTQLLNFFQIAPGYRLVDLPGYGFAKVPLAVKQQWQYHLTAYLTKRHSLKGLILLMDSRHPLKAFDQQMLTWAQQAQLAVHLLLTKADKLTHQQQRHCLRTVQQYIAEQQLTVSVQLFSATTSQGLPELIDYLDQWLVLEQKKHD